MAKKNSDTISSVKKNKNNIKKTRTDNSANAVNTSGSDTVSKKKSVKSDIVTNKVIDKVTDNINIDMGKKEISNIKRYKPLLLFVIVLVFFLVGFYTSLFFFAPKLTLIGKKNITVEVGDVYEELGAKALHMNKDISKDIKATGMVDVTKLGTYKIDYSVKRWLFTVTKIRAVTVVDSQVPIITLKGKNKLSMCPSDKYEESGYTAIDNYDGDLTDNVKVEEKAGKINYSVSDSSGNIGFAYRDIERVDVTKPVITLEGSSSIFIALGTKYEDKGANATDNCDGDLTKNILVTNNVDSTKEGKYTVIYKVKDNVGNETFLERVVTVGASSSFDAGNAVSIAVLNYHFFYDSNTQTCNESICLEKKVFESHLKYLKDNNFYTITMAELDLWMDKKIELPKKSVLITVDDGAMGTDTHLIELLENYDMKATLFLITAWWSKDKYKSSNLEIQSHGHDIHIENYCKGVSRGAKGLCLSEEELVKDFNKSRDKLDNPIAFCYPFYLSNQNMRNALEKTDFKLAFVGGNVKMTRSSNRMSIPRYVVYNYTTANNIANMVN